MVGFLVRFLFAVPSLCGFLLRTAIVLKYLVRHSGIWLISSMFFDVHG